MRLLALVLLALAVAPATAAAPDARAPRVSLAVTFVQEEFKTTYAIRGAAKARDIAWKFTKPPNEPTCTQFASAGRGATWLHGDQHGCNHQAMTARGHEGTITVAFKLRGYTCRITHQGSETASTRGRCRK